MDIEQAVRLFIPVNVIGNIGNATIKYLNITLFTSVASKQFGEKLLDLEKQGIEALVIDVRGNSGGYLTTVVDIASQLLPSGKVIYQIEKEGKKTVHKDKTNEHRKYPRNKGKIVIFI